LLAVAERSWRDTLADVADLEVEADVLLAPLTTFRIGGPAEVVARPLTAKAAADVWGVADGFGVPLTILGGGTNVLISDRGIRGLVVDLSAGFSYLHEHPHADGTSVWEVGAGCGTGKVVRRGIVRGLRGPEVLAGVPGSIGGALVMNAGGHEGEIQSMVRRVLAVVGGEVTWLSRQECGFAYRKSAFPPRSIILGAEFELAPGDAAALRSFVKKSQSRRKATQPLELPNAGSIFKNPPGDFAGRLIEAAGCKGWREGGAEVSPKHANFIVNTGAATAHDVAALARRVREAVRAQHGVTLELEVKLLGEFAPEVLP
jgi:UDP-N-acetylmuramate dehydrogenase